MANIAFYGSHNATYVIEDQGKIVVVAEVERLLNYKNSGMAIYKTPKADDILFLGKYLADFFCKKYGIKEFDVCYHAYSSVIIDQTTYHLHKYIPAKQYVDTHHHLCHAAGTFYQSPYKEALIFSFDGGGNDGKFNIYTCKRGESPVRLEQVINPKLNNPHIYYDLGFPYMTFAHFLDDIRFTDIGTGNLVYPGKLMGLAPYGKANSEWLPYFIDYYKGNPDGYKEQYHTALKDLGSKIGVEFDTKNRIKGQQAYDVAATAQRAFEECFLEVAKPYIDRYPDLPICLTGGCALNIILNTRVKNEFKREVFVGPNPNDCGVALGMILNELKPETPVDITYSGLPLHDIDMIPEYVQNTQCIINNKFYKFTSHKLDVSTLVNDLLQGKIIGIARGRSEHGPRALGNRSILCNPSIPGMKDTLNAKVKHREWYRPFAPVVRLEDVSTYFEWEGDSRWMNFCPLVKEEWRLLLSAITHVDGTARVQTVTREQNPWLYDLLTLYNEKTGVGVLLNTSFNVDGKPILSTVKDAFSILKDTYIDGIVIEDYYFIKH